MSQGYYPQMFPRPLRYPTPLSSQRPPYPNDALPRHRNAVAFRHGNFDSGQPPRLRPPCRSRLEHIHYYSDYRYHESDYGYGGPGYRYGEADFGHTSEDYHSSRPPPLIPQTRRSTLPEHPPSFSRRGPPMLPPPVKPPEPVISPNTPLIPSLCSLGDLRPPTPVLLGRPPQPIALLGDAPSPTVHASTRSKPFLCQEPVVPAAIEPRPRRILFEKPPDPSDSKSSEFMIVDYGHSASKSDLSKMADILCFDYDHGNGTKPKMQNRFDSHLVSMQRSKDDSKSERSTDAASTKEQYHGDDCFHAGEEFYYRLALDAMNQYDQSYEQSIWDYDPKFTWDYLPGTSRGDDEVKEFIMGRDYYEEETKWKRHKRFTERMYSHEISERKAKLEKGESLYNEEEDKPISVAPPEIPDPIDELFRRFEAEIGFPEDGISEDYCVICRLSFQSVLSSIEHYEGTGHEQQLRKHFISGLLKMGLISRPDNVPRGMDNGIIKRGMKTYRTRPPYWSCHLCNVTLTSLAMAELHFEGTAHNKRRQELVVSWTK